MEKPLRADIVLYQTLHGAKTSAEKGNKCIISQHLLVRANFIMGKGKNQ
jgi:hypothetical protein